MLALFRPAPAFAGVTKESEMVQARNKKLKKPCHPVARPQDPGNNSSLSLRANDSEAWQSRFILHYYLLDCRGRYTPSQ